MKRRTYRVLFFLAVISVVFAACLAHYFHPQGWKYTDFGAQDAVSSDSTFEIHFFDVGEGDSALVECDGHYMLIDGGTSGNS
jgi:beta-lactamase superfamily II metal-dependent hydrolase